MENKTIFCSTKRFEGDDATKTKLTLDMSNVSETELVEYAVDALVIKWQASIRRKKGEVVPTEATYKVPKPGTRAAATLSPFEMLTSIFGKDKALQLVNEYGSVENVVEALKDFLPVTE